MVGVQAPPRGPDDRGGGPSRHIGHFAGAQRAGQVAGGHQRPVPGGDELRVLGIFEDATHLAGVIFVKPGQRGAGE